MTELCKSRPGRVGKVPLALTVQRSGEDSASASFRTPFVFQENYLSAEIRGTILERAICIRAAACSSATEIRRAGNRAEEKEQNFTPSFFYSAETVAFDAPETRAIQLKFSAPIGRSVED